jgi:hypothetical protein
MGKFPDNKLIDGLVYAIQNKYVIIFHYGGKMLGLDPDYTRQGWRMEVQPVALGRNAKSGRYILRAWQTKGVTNTNKPAWKTFLIDEMKSLAVYDGSGDYAYWTFDRPGGPGFNTTGDKHMVNGKPEYMIDINKPPGPNREEPKNEKPEDDETSNIEPEGINERFTNWLNYLLLIRD